MTNNSIFTRVFALVLCLVMLAGVMTSCFNNSDHNHGVGTNGSGTTNSGTDTKPTTTTPTTGDSVEKDPEEDPVDPNEIFSASASLGEEDLIYGTLASDVVIGSAELGAVVPADVKVAEGASNLALSVKNVEDLGDVDLGDAEIVQSLDIHIDGVAFDNTVPMIVNLGAILEAGLSETEIKLYHHENGVPTLMTRVNNASEFAIHNQYTYNPETGEVSIFVASFSVFTIVQTSADDWDGTYDISWYNINDNSFTLNSAEQFAGFRIIVDGGYYDDEWNWVEVAQDSFKDKTVTLACDINLKNIQFDPIGYSYTYNKDSNTAFMGTFDGGKHTIYGLAQNGWELDPDKTNYGRYTYSTAGGGLFASIENANIRNIAISGAEIVFECVDMGIVVGYAQGTCSFENIVVTNSKIANYNRYTGGVVGEVSYGPYGTDTTKGYSHIFRNITVDSSVKVCGLWGSFGCGMGGVIGGKWNDATVLMENVISAPVMDVYNDVVSAYQWYAFRGCGMLIGHTEEPYSDGRHSGIATANFLTCQNVKVYYGDWVNYHYYEFKNQDNTTGQRYPWVRAEEGEYCDAFSNIRYGVPTHNGVKVSEDSKMEDLKTNYTPIVFDQLYGADLGMYGQAAHEGVTVSKTNTKTFYIENNLDWTNLKLHYWYKNGEDTWTNLTDGITLKEENGVYAVEVPAYAYGFTISAKDGKTIEDAFIVSDLIDGDTYPLARVQVDGAYYATLQGAINDSNGGTVTLLEDINLCRPVEINESNVTLNLNGKTINADYNGVEVDGKSIVEVLLVKGQSKVVITGNGKMNATGDGEYVQVISAIDGAEVTIVNGTFVSNGCTAIYATRGAKVTIYGGHFDAKEKYEGKYYTLDIDESVSEGERGEIIVYGGIYVNFDPADHTNDGAGYTNKLASACYATNSDTNEYTVVANHKFVDNKCECGAERISKWELLTDASTLANGDKIIIVAANSNVAMGTTQNSNNRNQVEIVKNPDKTVTINSNVQIITLEAGNIEGTFAFNVGDGYLYAASSSSNHLKTQNEVTDDGSWLITISDNVTTIEAQGKNTRNWLRHNNSSSLFSCYSSGQQDVAIYKLSASENVIDAHDCNTFAIGAACGVNATCALCGKEIEGTAIGHSYASVVTEPTCIKGGYTTNTCSKCGDVEVIDQTDALGHSFDGDNCSVCGEAKPQTGDPTTYIFNDYTAGTQYAENEKHVLDDNTTIFTTQCHFTSELRIYASDTHNGYAIIKSSNPITTIGINAGDNADTIVIYGSNDNGTTWTVVAEITVTSKYADYTAELTTPYTWLKLDVSGSNQIRVKSITLTTGEPCDHSYEAEVTAPTCTTDGYTTYTCSKCGYSYTGDTVSATGHTYVDGTCACGETEDGSTEPTEPTVVLEITAEDFNSSSYAANNNTKKEGDYSYTSYQVMLQSKTMQWQKGNGYITIEANVFVKLEMKVTAGTYTVTVGDQTVTGTTSDGITTYDLTGLTGEIKISVSSNATGKVDYLKFYK